MSLLSRRRVLPALLATATVAIGLIGLGPAAAAPAGRAPAAVAAAASHPSGTKPTVVLVHGAWADSSSWTDVIIKLQHDGYTVLAAPNPLRSLSGDAATVRDFLATVPGPIILVGHSYGGAVITNAATGNPDVKALVYIDAFAPAQGETIFPLSGADSALAVDPATVFDFRPYPGAPAGDVDLYLKPAVVARSFAQDVGRQKAAVLAATQRPLALSAGNEPSGVPAWKTIPSWYLLGTQDKIITPTAQRFMAERAHSHITLVRSSHVSLISHPAAVESLVVKAARATA
ncbi:MAG TPA: alpha/beta hydrolase [Mycobacteriales bacterium]|jgi:pimeloyl-ACP methyl ester carboxylesterase|nr:alpha/beta hydrolase [Mycobacteriales bacterium]